MNDDFLTRFRKPPRREFSADLYQRINTPMNAPRSFAVRKWTLAGAALCLALIAAVAFSPTVRAAFSALIREIGGIIYIGPEETPGQPAPSEDDVTLVPEETVAIADVQAKVPYAFSLPEWAPDHYTMSSMARLSYFPSTLQESGTATFVFFTWQNSDVVGGNGLIELVISPKVQWLVDLDHLTEVKVNGEPAGLTGGNWNADTGQWDASNNDLTLTWLIGDVMYQLRSPGGATVQELIQMAESIH